MNRLSDRRAMVESALTAMIASFFIISLMYIPILFMLIFLVPVPFVVLTSRHNVRYGIFSLIITSLLIGLLIDIVFTIFVLLFFGPMALAMGYMIKKHSDEFSVVGIGATIGIFTIFLSIQLLSIVGGFNFIDQVSLMMREAIQHQMDSFASMKLDAVSIDNFINYFTILFPSIIIVYSIFLTLINYYVSISILRRIGFSDAPVPEFGHFKLPGNIVLGSFLIMILSYFTRFFEGMPTDSLMSNILLLFTFVFLIQGLAFVSFFLKQHKFPFVIRILIMGIILLISPLLIFVSMLGLMDSVWDIRKIRAK